MSKSFLVLGGAGDMGSSVVEDLASHADGDLIIGDINKESIEKVASRLKNKGHKIKGIKVDVSNRKQMNDALGSADIVVNTVGPFYRFEQVILDAVKSHDVGYVDICDDYDVTFQIFNSNNRDARGRIIVGMGWTPGITNICARDAFNQMDSVNDINIAWSGSAADASGKAVIEHVFHAVTGDVPMFLDGKLTSVPARQSRREIDFPEPVNKVETFYTGHPEPITIPIFLKGVKNVTVRGALVPDWQNHLISQFADIGLTEKKMINVRGTKISSREFLVEFVHETLGQFRAGGVDRSAFWVEVKGKKGGKDVTMRYSGADRMRRLTGIPAAIGAQFLAESNLKRGIYAPEGAIDPKFFFAEIRKRKIRIRKVVETEEF